MNIHDLQKQKKENTTKIQQYYFDSLQKVNYKGIFGVANFSNVYNELLSVQQNKLKNILKEQFDDYLKTGSIVCLGIFYFPKIIDCINVETNGIIDKVRWNLYGDEYLHLNNMLKKIGDDIAKKVDGISLPPTTGVPAEDISNVIDYFPHTISHRVVAEHAGLGWRGKNELIITKENGPAVRFTSILSNIPLIQGEKIENLCGECEACLEICPILKNKQNLENYRENCRRYIVGLRLTQDVCGKCIKACYHSSIIKETFKFT